MEQVDCVVIGAGVVGLAVARALALAGREVLVLEAAAAIGTGTSARNSEVIHAGIYYPAGSLKAALCVQGNALLYAYCAKHGVDHRRCGKLIVATSAEQVAQLAHIQNRARANGVADLVLLDQAQLHSLEPGLHAHAGLLSPSTGIVDSHALMLALQADLEQAGGCVVLNTRVEQADAVAGAVQMHMRDGTCLRAQAVVNSAGLDAPALAASIRGLDARHVPRAFFAKGNYFSLSSRAPFAHLIYPVPQPGGLGVHLTLDLGGQARFGPDVQWVDSAHDLSVDPRRGDCFYAEVRKYWPTLPDGSLQAAYCGIRPKIAGPGMPDADFVIQGPATHGMAGLVNLFGIESPGLTSALAIGQRVADLMRCADSCTSSGPE